MSILSILQLYICIIFSNPRGPLDKIFIQDWRPRKLELACWNSNYFSRDSNHFTGNLNFISRHSNHFSKSHSNYFSGDSNHLAKTWTFLADAPPVGKGRIPNLKLCCLSSFIYALHIAEETYFERVSIPY